MTSNQYQIKIIHILKKSLSLIIIILSKISRLFIKRKYNFNCKVAIISLHKLGDTVFTIPAVLEYLKNSNKDVYIFCYKESEIVYRQIIKNVSFRNFSRNDFYFNGRIASHRARKILKEIKPDIIVDMTGSITSASLIFFANCKTIYGINEELFKGIYDNYHVIRKKPHQIDIYFDALGTLIPINKKRFSGFISNHETSGTILIQPFAGWEAKEWGFLKFLKLYKKISIIDDCSFILPAGSIKDDVISSLEEDGIKMIFTENIESLITETKKCKLFISNDSGPLQIAALLGKPTFCIYGPTNPLFHIPFGEFHSSIDKQLKCSPGKEKYCFTFGGRYCQHYDCLKLISVDEVFEAIRKLLITINKFNVAVSNSLKD